MENYISFYRRYRPKNFKDVAGHSNVKDILISEISKGTVPNALLFVGQKGTGKTSLAKIMAKAINCESITHENYEPCNICDNCKMANDNSHPDIYEIDAASNNGVDEIRNIKQNVFTLPIVGKKKIFIIDEIHMLTTNAFNAFLKTLEEPPMHVRFILATTEFQKIPPTIFSRCQIFNFKKLNIVDVTSRLEEVLNVENIDFEKEALNEIFYMSDGSLRDALNYLEQVSAIAGEKINLDHVTSLFNISTKKEKIDFFLNILNGEAKKVINYFENFSSKGLDVEIMILQSIDMLKEIIEFKLSLNENILKILNKTDISYFDKYNLNLFFELTETLTTVYEKTNRTNITSQYLLISILRFSKNNNLISLDINDKNYVLDETIKSNSNFENTKMVAVSNEIENTETVATYDEAENVKVENFDVETDNFEVKVESAETEMSEVEIENFEAEEENFEAENSKVDVESLEIKVENAEKKIYEHEIKNDLFNFNTIKKFKPDEIDNCKMNLISKMNLSDLLEIDYPLEKIIEILTWSDNKGRLEVTNNLTSMFNEKKVIEECMFILSGAKVLGAGDKTLVFYVQNSLDAKIFKNLLQDDSFKQILFKNLNINERIVLVLEKELYQKVREVYKNKKDNNGLPPKDEKLFINFYNEINIHKSIITDQESEYYKRAKAFFGEDLIKVVD